MRHNLVLLVVTGINAVNPNCHISLTSRPSSGIPAYTLVTIPANWLQFTWIVFTFLHFWCKMSSIVEPGRGFGDGLET